jgi:hypothetical protein
MVAVDFPVSRAVVNTSGEAARSGDKYCSFFFLNAISFSKDIQFDWT